MSRFQLRRQKLKASGLCIYCGAEKACEGKTTCKACAAVKAVKRPHIEVADIKRKRLLKRRALITTALGIVEIELENLGGLQP